MTRRRITPTHFPISPHPFERAMADLPAALLHWYRIDPDASWSSWYDYTYGLDEAQENTIIETISRALERLRPLLHGTSVKDGVIVTRSNKTFIREIDELDDALIVDAVEQAAVSIEEGAGYHLPLLRWRVDGRDWIAEKWGTVVRVGNISTQAQLRHIPTKGWQWQVGRGSRTAQRTRHGTTQPTYRRFGQGIEQTRDRAYAAAAVCLDAYMDKVIPVPKLVHRHVGGKRWRWVAAEEKTKVKR